jgi:hypothetical protein
MARKSSANSDSHVTTDDARRLVGLSTGRVVESLPNENRTYVSTQEGQMRRAPSGIPR